MAILKHIASKSSNYGAALEYLIFKHDELRKTPILDQNGNRIMRDEFYLDGLNCEPYSFDAACQQLNREYQKNKNKNEIKSHHYIISFDPRDSTENCLTGKRAQELGLEYAKANFPGHQALVCTHMDGHNGSGNIHVHIVINSLRKLDVPQQPFMERPIDCKVGYKHHVTNEYLKHLQKSLMDLCRREFLHQVDLLSPSRTGVTEAEYWAQRRLDEKKQEIEKEGFTPNPTKFQTQKQLIRNAVAAAREKAISYELPPRTQFSMLNKPAVSIKYGVMKFNMACIRLFEGIKYVLPILHPNKKRLALIMCPEEDSASVEWARQKDENWVNKDITSLEFVENIFRLMNWNRECRYKVLGRVANSDQGLCMLFDLEEAIMFTPKPQEYTDPLTGEMKKKQMKFFPDAYKNRIGKSYNDYIADHQMNMFEDFIGYQSSTVLDEPEREAGTTSIPIPQREESENIPLPDLPGQLENVQQSGNEIAKRGMPT